MFNVGDILEVSKEHTYFYPKFRECVYEGKRGGEFGGEFHIIKATNGAGRFDALLTRTMLTSFTLKEPVSLENK